MTAVFDPGRTSLAELRGWVTECGYRCAGQSVPAHVCDPMAGPDAPVPGAVAVPVAGPSVHQAEQVRSPHEAMGRGGHGEMPVASMAADMRNRFVVAAVFAAAVLVWSPIGTGMRIAHLVGDLSEQPGAPGFGYRLARPASALTSAASAASFGTAATSTLAWHE